MPVYVRNSGEVYRADERLPARDPLIGQLARLMDGAVQVGPVSIGLDPVLGLVPGLGDMIGAMISMVIVIRAIQAGIPRVAVARMMTNIAIDTLIGAIPIVGDAFDFAYKANLKNLRIYEDALYQRRAATRWHWIFFGVLFLAGVVLIAALVYGIYSLLSHWRAF